ncbi:MAG: S8 family serine peptidase, partial [Planctomycetota bacterium]
LPAARFPVDQVSTNVSAAIVGHVAQQTGTYTIALDTAGQPYSLLATVEGGLEIEDNGIDSASNRRVLDDGSVLAGFLDSPLNGATQTGSPRSDVDAKPKSSLPFEDATRFERTVGPSGPDEAGRDVSVEPGKVTFLGKGIPPWEIDITAPTNANANDTTNADQVVSGGSLGLDLDGAGYTVGVFEAGNGLVRQTHREFDTRVSQEDSGSVASHATHVAGTIAASGIRADAKGAAPAANILSYTSGGAATEIRNDADRLHVTNHSYSIISGWYRGNTSIVGLDIGTQDIWFGDYAASQTESSNFGQYSSTSRSFDSALHDNPKILSVFSAGNDRNDNSNASQYVLFLSSDPGNVDGYSGSGWYLVDDSGATTAPGRDGNNGTGYDSLPRGGQTAKNTLTVGAINDATADPIVGSTLQTTSFSSYGPTDDGRIKPDVVANGASLLSTESSGDAAYGTKSGTSMSAPNAAGSAVLLVQHYEDLYGTVPDSATTKGLLIHTAVDAGRTGPDYAYGWGLVDTAAAATFLSDTADPQITTSLLVESQYVESTLQYEIIAGPDQPVRATLAWNDPSWSGNSSGLDDPSRALVHDLDVWITDESGSTYHPWTLDPANPTSLAVQTTRNSLDNVEQVLFTPPTTGTFTVHVGATGNVSPQDFSLLISGQVDLAPPPSSQWTDTFEIQLDTGDELVVTASPIASLASAAIATPGVAASELLLSLAVADDTGSASETVSAASAGDAVSLSFQAASPGVHLITLTSIVDNAGVAGSGEYVLTTQVLTDTIAPTIDWVKLGSTEWSESFLTAVDADQGLGVVVQPGEVYPWVNVDTLHVKLSEDVEFPTLPGSTEIDPAVVTLSSQTGQNDALTATAVAYDSQALIATITLASAIALDHLTVGITGVTDLAGNGVEGSEWTLSLLPADLTQDYRVSTGDVLVLRTELGRLAGDPGFDPMSDANGDGRISTRDVLEVRSHFADDLPAPTAPSNERAVDSVFAELAMDLAESVIEDEIEAGLNS